MNTDIKIGILIPQSKQYKGLDRDFMRGLKLSNPDVKFFVENIGIGSDERIAIEKIQKLNLQEDITIIIGFFGHHNMEHVYEYAADNDILLIASDMGATMAYGNKKREGVYINSFALTESAYLLGGHFLEKSYAKIASATSYYDSGYGILSAIESSFNESIDFSGHYITPFIPREDEAKHMEGALQAYNPDAVFAFYSGLYAHENAEFISQNKIHEKYPFYVTALSVTEKIIEEYQNASQNLYIVSSWLNNSNDECEFNIKYTDVHAGSPSFFSMLGYENGLVLRYLLQNLNKNFSVKNMIKVMDALQISGPRGLIAFDNETNRTIFNHHIYKLNPYNNEIKFKKVNTLENNGHFIKAITSQDVPPKVGGWQNAYLCH